jgi:competence protein ComEA
MAEIPKGRLLAYAVAAVLVIVTGIRFLEGRGEGSGAEQPAIRVDAAPSGAPGTSEAGRSGSSTGELYVHVAGAVRRPGLYRVPRGSRVAAAIERAGGVSRRAELAGVNLAAQLQDGQQVVVPRKGAAGAPAVAGAPGGGGTAQAGGAPSAGAPISLATATPEQLDTLDGIGPTLAARIIEYRDSHGGFRSVSELRQVEGIGEKRFEALREAVRP